MNKNENGLSLYKGQLFLCKKNSMVTLNSEWILNFR